MMLHRAGLTGQWEAIPPQERNAYQRAAARSGGRVTPANAVSILSTGLVMHSLADITRGRFLKGTIKLGAGRVGDLLDGAVAERTGTKGPVGEAIDALLDKVAIGAALPVLTVCEVTPPPAAGLIMGLNIANARVAGEAKLNHKRLHPSEDGKKATFGYWAGICLYGLAAEARQRKADTIAYGLEFAAGAGTAAAAILGVKAYGDYKREAAKAS